MIKLAVNRGNLTVSKGKEIEVLSESEMLNIIRKLRLGTKVFVNNVNQDVKKHRGQYYLLFEEEFDSVYILYIDLAGNLRQVAYSPISETIRLMSKNIADETEVIILKSDSKNAYRVYEETQNEGIVVREMLFKDKSSKQSNRVYMSILDAFKLATHLYKLSESNKRGSNFYVVTPKDNPILKLMSK